MHIFTYVTKLEIGCKNVIYEHGHGIFLGISLIFDYFHDVISKHETTLGIFKEVTFLNIFLGAKYKWNIMILMIFQCW